jgi:hypothetical protein
VGVLDTIEFFLGSELGRWLEFFKFSSYAVEM